MTPPTFGLFAGAVPADAVALALALVVVVASALLGADSLAKKALAAAAVVVGATCVVGASMQLVPGDPVASILGEDAPQASHQALARELLLVDDRGVPRGPAAQLGGFLRGAASSAVLAVAPSSLAPTLAPHLADEPRSFRTRRPVREVVLERLPYTLVLAASSVLLAVVVGVGLGVLSALRRARALAALAQTFSLLGAAVPRFWLAPLLVIVFAIELRALPVSGAEGARALVLPTVSLGTALAALLSRMSRTALLEVAGADFVRTARAKGHGELGALLRHGLPAALPPILTVVGLQVGGVLAGAVVTEKVFSWPGIGLLLTESVRRLDVPVVQGVVLVTSFFAVGSTLVVEAVLEWVDPRRRRRAP